ncbi:uncharacterized protein LOC143916571 [Arctopsyche grandis]|uniref:uncharacterized protein LOC143916571 n=1 Tax=Arctopsyche grandis TaxID=121162 RepID=UPI00406D81E8
MEVFQTLRLNSRTRLIARNYLLMPEKIYGDRHSWYCNRRRSEHCGGRALTKLVGTDHILLKFSEHNHPAAPHELQVKQLVDRIKEYAESTETTTRKIIQDAMVSVPITELPNMPSYQALRAMIQRVRRDKRPKDPQTSAEINVTPALKITCNKQPFLIIDVTLGDDRILVFSTVTDLIRLAQGHWIIDGTFKTVAPISYRLCTIHTKAAYVKAFEEIRNFAAGNGATLAPQLIISNLEREAINATETVFPGVENKVCFYHFEQCVWRKIQSSGLEVQYHEELDFALSIKQLKALAFVPWENIPQAFDEVANVMPEGTHAIVEWMKDHYVHGKEQVLPDGTVTRTPPPFPPKMWSLYNSTTHGIPRTQTDVEFWHRRCEAFIGKSYVGIGKMIEFFQREQHKVEDVELISKGQSRPGRRKEIEKGKKIAAIVGKYHTRKLLDYLKRLSPYLD